mmetsp:Transcript_67076/g.119361  ORF Transcript_67076/g.119361 Transcript_67076/m.119361 type:complete len:280 (+) Transcript_67076:72-911(+)
MAEEGFTNNVAEQPPLLAIQKTGDIPGDVEYLKNYVGLWTHAPLEGKNVHVYCQKRKAEDPLADVLYWQDDTEHWRTGQVECADPDSESFGCGAYYFHVPGGPEAKYAGSYEVDGLTFLWNPSEEQQQQAEEDGRKAAEAEAKEWEGYDQQAEGEPGVEAEDDTYVVEESAAIIKEDVDFAVECSEGEKTQEQLALEKFQSWDANGDSLISKEELLAVFESISPDFFTMENINTMASAADVDKDGSINYKEFMLWIFKADNCEKNDNENVDNNEENNNG